MNFHEREKKWNIIFLIFGIILMVLLVGMLYWSRETEAAESRRLQEMAKKTEDSDKTNAGTKVETEKSEEVKEEPESVPEEEEKNPEGIVCWGDDLINGEASAKYSYKVVLQKLLEENGYTLPVQDKTLQGAGTLSMMTMAGVPDYYITGSDQVWNTDITNGLSDIYTLNFGKKDIKRISYGASIGKGELSVEEQIVFRSKLQYIDSISVREETAKRLLEQIFPNKHISVVLDPTLLLKREEWENLLEGVKAQKNKKYILAYMVEENQEFRKIARDLEEKTGYPIFHFEKKNLGKNVKSCYTAGVLEFVNYIKNAEYVITTSFHATVFSIMFHKKFWIIPHETTGSRVIDLVNSLELSNRIVNTLDMFLKVNYSEDINYERVERMLDMKRQQSLQWLKNEVKAEDE